MEVKTPLESLRSWIASQPAEVQATIYLIVGLRVVDLCKTKETDFILAPKDHFESWLGEKSYAAVDDIVSAALHLRELIQFFVIDHFGSKAQWEHIVDSNSSIADEFRSRAPESSLVELAEGVVRSAPFRQRLWERSASDWNNFVSESLTNQHLQYWLLKHRVL